MGSSFWEDIVLEAALDLLTNLSAEDQAVIGLTTETVSDSEEGTGLRITNPLGWLGDAEAREEPTSEPQQITAEQAQPAAEAQDTQSATDEAIPRANH